MIMYVIINSLGSADACMRYAYIEQVFNLGLLKSTQSSHLYRVNAPDVDRSYRLSTVM